MLGKSVYEIDNTFTRAEILEWSEYIADNPPEWVVDEIQNAYIANGIYSQFGGKSEMTDFMITVQIDKQSGGIHDMSVDEINRLAGVA